MLYLLSASICGVIETEVPGDPIKAEFFITTFIGEI